MIQQPLIRQPSHARRSLAVASIFLLGMTASVDATILNLADWNMANRPNNDADRANLSTVLGYVGSASGLARPLDLLAMIETDPTSAEDTRLAAVSAFGSDSYASLIGSADGGGDRTGFIYNTSTLSLLSSVEVAPGLLTHHIVRAEFRPAGTSGTADFYVYSVHLRSGETSAIRTDRLAEAQALRADADALGSANVVFVGDFNWQGAHERGAGVASAFTAFTDPGGDGQVFDAANAVGEWRDNPAFLSLHTNDPGGAMDDRFDMQMISGELLDGTGIDYVNNSYKVVGNNGTHQLNGMITTGTGAPANVLSALAAFSDHLPVLGQYNVIVPEPGMIGFMVGTVGFLTRRRRSAR